MKFGMRGLNYTYAHTDGVCFNHHVELSYK